MPDRVPLALGKLYTYEAGTTTPVTTYQDSRCDNSEFAACRNGEMPLARGTKFNGTVLFAQRATDKYRRPRLVLDLSSIVYRDGSHSPLYVRVLSVDNSRETVPNNEFRGIIQPRAASKASLLMAAVNAAHPPGRLRSAQHPCLSFLQTWCSRAVHPVNLNDIENYTGKGIELPTDKRVAKPLTRTMPLSRDVINFP